MKDIKAQTFDNRPSTGNVVSTSLSCVLCLLSVANDLGFRQNTMNGSEEEKDKRKLQRTYCTQNDYVQKARKKKTGNRSPVPKSRPHSHFILIIQYIEYRNGRGWIFAFLEMFLKKNEIKTPSLELGHMKHGAYHARSQQTSTRHLPTLINPVLVQK